MHTFAKKYGGKCLSGKYIDANTKLKWQCEKGHVWEATPSNVRHGHWCLECSGSKKKSIQDMQKIAEIRGGECLSKEYVNNKTKLKWQCNEGHVWEAVPSSVAKRTWCPVCGRAKSQESNKLTIEEIQLIAQKRKGKLSPIQSREGPGVLSAADSDDWQDGGLTIRSTPTLGLRANGRTRSIQPSTGELSRWPIGKAR